MLRDAALDTSDHVRRELAQRALRSLPAESDITRRTYLAAAQRARGTERARAALLGLGNLKDEASFRALVDLLEAEEDREIRLAIL
ncbi:MAG: hypothetical protein L0209_06735, partial [candidate division Zixibacteria bacterium]|nr:hypothetical protein [candidate division Zixibacteria bacterium]